MLSGEAIRFAPSALFSIAAFLTSGDAIAAQLSLFFYFEDTLGVFVCWLHCLCRLFIVVFSGVIAMYKLQQQRTG